MGQEREPFDLLVVCQLLLEGVDALLHHLVDLRIGTELLVAVERDMMLTGLQRHLSLAKVSSSLSLRWRSIAVSMSRLSC